MDLKEFRASTAQTEPPAEASSLLQAMWYDAKGDWNRAHELAQANDNRDGAWVHAYLHRVEGDLSNAAYWYRRADRPVSDQTLSDEWDEIVSSLLRL